MSKEEQKTPVPVVHLTRSMNPEKPTLSDEIIQKHERSVRMYPNLNLSEGEYVITSVRRHPIGLIAPQAIGAVLLAIMITVMTTYGEVSESFSMYGGVSTTPFVVVIAFLFSIAIIIGMVTTAFVYLNNKFYLTNESVIQEIRHSLLSKHEQTVSLANIEDASYTKKGLLQYAFDYGNVRLSTEGEETTYRFSYVANPKGHVDRLNNVVEAFKNGRPIED